MVMSKVKKPTFPMRDAKVWTVRRKVVYLEQVEVEAETEAEALEKAAEFPPLGTVSNWDVCGAGNHCSWNDEGQYPVDSVSGSTVGGHGELSPEELLARMGLLPEELEAKKASFEIAQVEVVDVRWELEKKPM